jgi:hypothetical protein
VSARCHRRQVKSDEEAEEQEEAEEDESLVKRWLIVRGTITAVTRRKVRVTKLVMRVTVETRK